MTENLQKIIGVKQIPIFPLPLVLLPFEFLPLHIFEPRYRQMLEDAQIENNLFGISHLGPSESLEKPMVDSVGCAAEILETERLDDGRSNLLTIGVIRYQIKNYVETEKPYLIADVDFFEDDEEDLDKQSNEADEVFGIFKQVTELARIDIRQNNELSEIPQAPPEQLSFLACAALNIDVEARLRTLENRSTTERLVYAKEILLKTLSQIKEAETINKISQTNGHSKKDIDLDGI